MKEDHQYQPSVGAPVFAAVLAALLCLIFRVCSSAHELEVYNAMGEAWKWLLEVVGSAILASIVTALISYKMFFKSLLEKYMTSVKDDLKPNNQILHDEHSQLSSTIHEARTDVQKDVAKISEITSFLRDAQIREDGRRDRMEKKQLDAQQVADVITAQNALISDLRDEIARLKEELSQFQSRPQKTPDALDVAAQRIRQNAVAQEPEEEQEP